MKIFRSHSASALLLTFFLTALLILVGIGVSLLVIRDISTVRTVVGGSQARYAAEGMTEHGLLLLKEQLPGYEVEDDTRLFLSGAEGKLTIVAREQVVPCSLDDSGGDEGNLWRSLRYNESVQLPLFAARSDGSIEDLDRFYVEFYLGDSEGVPVPSAQFQAVDVLRWKILGTTANQSTEAISEFIPIDGVNTKENPTFFGSATPSAAADGYSNAKYYALDPNGRSYTFYPNYPIETFLNTHETNYLVMTNVVQVTSPSPENFYIYFRLHSADLANDAVCEFAILDAQGDSTFGNARQSVETWVKEGENLPVFDFVLYHTSGEQVELTPALAPFVAPFNPFAALNLAP